MLDKLNLFFFASLSLSLFFLHLDRLQQIVKRIWWFYLTEIKTMMIAGYTKLIAELKIPNYNVCQL
jgi:hypothetical protein